LRFGINPLQWWATDDGWINSQAGPSVDELSGEAVRAGFSSISLPIRTGTTAAECTSLLARHELSAAPTFFNGALEKVEERPKLLETARRNAEVSAGLGLGEVFIAADTPPDAARVATAAIGVQSSHDRLATITESLMLVGEASLEFGVTSCLHQHVGSWIETEEELESVLDQISAETIALGPDTGHLAWAGIDPIKFIERHLDRVRAVHIKDIRLAVADDCRRREKPYRDTVMSGLWVEPGRGDLDLGAVIALFEGRTAGWAVVEVDRADLSTNRDSARASAAWVSETASAVGST
jgi:inosose dehydratase